MALCRAIPIAILSLIILASAVFVAPTADENLSAYLDQEWQYFLKEFPIFATFVGDYRYNDKLGDFSHDAILNRQQHDLAALNQLKKIDRNNLSDNQKLNYDLYMDRLDGNIAGHRFPEYLMPITQLGGVHIDAPSLVDNLPLRATRDYEDYVSRMKQFPQAFDHSIALLKIGLDRGITPPRITLRDVASQIKAQITENPELSHFYKPFQEFPPVISSADKQRLQNKVKEVVITLMVPAYQKLYDFWIREYYPKTRNTTAISALPDGKAWYAYLAKTHTTTDLTPDQIHEIGLSEVKRLRVEMDALIVQSGFTGSFEEFTTFLRTDPQFFYTKPEELVAAYRDICKRIEPELPKFFRTLPRTPYGVKEIPSFSAPSATSAYYTPGSMSGSIPGWFFVNTHNLEMRPKWQMEALAVHETVPGHHLQLSIAEELENVPRFRNFTVYNAFIEGWGLYSESLGADMGLYKDTYSKFGQLSSEMWRACRLVVDTGLHHFGWDRQKAIDYFKVNTSGTEQDIIVEIDRYIVNPGQALSYKIGELKIKELREYASRSLGKDFDIREFHDRLLRGGAVPLSLLEKQIKEYVEEKKQSRGSKR